MDVIWLKTSERLHLVCCREYPPGGKRCKNDKDNRYSLPMQHGILPQINDAFTKQFLKRFLGLHSLF